MKVRMFRNALAVGIILLFIGVAVQPSIATVHPEKEIIDVEPKDYLFQTIIDIANNPEVKKLLEKYKHDLFEVHVDRSVYHKLFLKNPRLFFDTLFSKPSMSIDYFDKCYNKGIEITKILGEEKVLEMIESIEVTNSKLFDELNNIIMNDQELSGTLGILKEMNKDLNHDTAWEDIPIICSILLITALVSGLIWAFIFTISATFMKLRIISEIILLFSIPFDAIILISIAMLVSFQCITIYYY